MQVSVENTSNLGRKISITIPAEKVNSDTQKRLQKIASTAKLKGFRPGKVPYKVIQERYGDAARGEVIGEIMQTSLFDALKEKDLQPAAQPTIDEIKAEEGEPLKFVASFEILPEVKLADFSKIKITKPTVDITADDIDSMLENIRKQHITWEEVERPAQDSDQVNIDFKGTINGEAFQGGEAKEINLVLGDARFIPGFEEALVGLKAGENKDIDITFPEDYPAKELAAKKAVFAVTVNKVSEPKLPEINDGFAKTLGIKEGGLDALKEQIKEHMQRELEHTILAKLKEEVLDKLLEENNVEAPESIVKNEIELLHKQHHEGQDVGDHDHESHPELEQKARKRVALGLLISEIIKQHNIKVDRSKINDRIDALASSYQQPEQIKAWYLNNKEMLTAIESSILEEQVVEKIIEMADVIEEKSTYKEIMNVE